MKEFFMSNQLSLRSNMVKVWDLACETIAAGPIIVTVSTESRTQAMNRKFHGMIGDIAKQVKVFTRSYSVEIWKALLVDRFEQELTDAGNPLSKPSHVIPNMDGDRMITVRASTTGFTKREASDFIEFIYSEGAAMDVVWGQKSIDTYNETQKR